jgi:formate hydrogenlyase subunit 3/multisubunit Na+/H+ antiporter MnhD subunit
MQPTEMVVAVLIPLGFFLMLFGIIYMYKRENLAMIDKGMNPKEFANRPAPYQNLKWGLLLIGSGVGLLLAYFITQYIIHDYQNPALWFALIAVGGGIGLVYSYKIEKKELLDNEKGE